MCKPHRRARSTTHRRRRRFLATGGANAAGGTRGRNRRETADRNLRGRPVLLRHGVGHRELPDDLCVLRDGAIPGHRLWHRINPKTRTPTNSIWLGCGLSLLVGALSLYQANNYSVAFFAMTGMCVVGLYIAYAIPIYLRLNPDFQQGEWNLRGYSKLVGWTSVVWVAFISILFFAPPFWPFWPPGGKTTFGAGPDLHRVPPEQLQLHGDHRRPVHRVAVLVDGLGEELVQGPPGARHARGVAGDRDRSRVRRRGHLPGSWRRRRTLGSPSTQEGHSTRRSAPEGRSAGCIPPCDVRVAPRRSATPASPTHGSVALLRSVAQCRDGPPRPVNVLAIDQGTSATKALVVGDDGEVLARPRCRCVSRPGRRRGRGRPRGALESVLARRPAALAARRRPGVDAVGLANQGETVLAWDRATAAPLTPAIVWQDRRSPPRLRAAGRPTPSGSPRSPGWRSTRTSPRRRWRGCAST